MDVFLPYISFFDPKIGIIGNILHRNYLDKPFFTPKKSLIAPKQEHTNSIFYILLTHSCRTAIIFV